MNIFEIMDASASSFSKTDRLIYESIRKFPDEFANESITTISEKAGYSKPALSRFAKRLGFGGFAEFQYQLSQDLKSRREKPAERTNAEIYANLLIQVEESLKPDVIKALVERMRSSRQTVIFGTNLSRLPAEMLYISLQFEKDILPVLPPNDIPPIIHGPEDLYIFFSAYKGDSHQNIMKDLRKLPEEKRPYLVLVTANSKHPLRHNFNETIVLPSVSLASGSQVVYSDTFAFMMFNDFILRQMNR